MGLYIAKHDPFKNFDYEAGAVQVELIFISKYDPGLGEDTVVSLNGIQCIPVTYTMTVNGAPQERLNLLVNGSGVDHGQYTSWFSPPHIVIAGVKNGYQLNDGTPITNALSLRPWTHDPRNPFHDYCVFFNVETCAAANNETWVKDTSGNKIATNHTLRLYHELALCFEAATGGIITDEYRAITVENELRAVHGVSYRDPYDATWGCGPPDIVETTGCFPSSARVLTPAGWRRMGDLQPGDAVVSLDRRSGRPRVRIVTRRLDRAPAEIWEITLDNGEPVVPTTMMHTFLTRHGWVSAYQLSPGQELMTLDAAGSARVVSVRRTGRGEPVHSLYTSGDHNFVVQGCVAHNFKAFRTLRTWWHRLFVDWRAERGAARRNRMPDEWPGAPASDCGPTARAA
jgi:hypothetical protein